MSPSHTILLALASLSTIYATPLALLPRSPRTIQEQGFGNKVTGVSFDPLSPTCPSSLGWGQITSDSTADFKAAVNTRPACDNVINSICNVVNFWHISNTPIGSMNSLYHADSGCEGRFIISTQNYKHQVYKNTVDYPTCVAKFQSIVIDCMNVGESDSAVAGSQYGAVNARYVLGSGWQKVNGVEEGKDGKPENQNADPGYLMGPSGVFSKGLEDSTDSSTIVVTIPA